MPLRAANAVEMAITNGIARPRAWGQAITSTVTVRSIAWSRLTQSQPHRQGEDAGAHGEVEQQRRRPVGQGLGPGAGGLGLLDQSSDPGQGGFLPDRVDLDPQGRVGDHRPGDHPGAARPWAPGGTRR